MGSRSEWYCWEIMHCENPDDCPAKKKPQIPCWEIASELDDYRQAFNICRDCVVRMIKAGNSLLSSQEIMEIMKTRAKCSLVDEDSRYSPQTSNTIRPLVG